MPGLEVLVGLVISVGLGWNGLMIRQLLASRKQELEQNHQAIELLDDRQNQLELRVSGLQLEIERRYVQREDWIRFSSQIDHKLDGMNQRVEERFERLTNKLEAWRRECRS